jgi:alkylhydroperoxidase family enzyme
MSDRFAPLLADVRRAVLDAPATTSTALRRAAASRGELPASLAAYVDKVHDAAYDITDADIAALQAAGHDDDAIFELTVAVAIGAASHRAARALAVLDEVSP